ncbi:hypothetical protein, partial [Enterobacter hormaechei]
QLTLDFDGTSCTLDLASRSSGAWREGLAITFERGSLTIDLPPPFSEEEAEVTLDRDGRITRLPRGTSWAFRRQADAFIADIIEGRMPIASGED